MNNDRFKFRVWDKKYKNYVAPSTVALLPSGVIAETDFDEGLFGTLPFSSDVSTELIIEQCTGLRDRNGELIYEGDIVRYNYPGAPHEIVSWNHKTCRWVTRAPEDAAMVFATSIAINSQLPDEGLIIVGNIHEGEK